MAVMAIMTVTAAAQAERGFRMGIRANVGVSNVIYEDDEAAFGYGIGLIAEYRFNPHVYIQSGIGLENISHKENYVGGAFDAYYAQLPIHIGCRTGVGGGKKLFVQAGPTFGYGLYGSDVDDGSSSKFNYFDLAERFDVGLGGRVGIESGRIQISVGTYYGLLDVIKDYGGHNFYANFGLAFMF